MATPEAGPNFFIIGAPKCGTTALSEYLRTHPQIFMTEPKEPNFFNRDLDYYNLGDPDSLDGYLQLYADAREKETIRGEASVWYLLSKAAAKRIHTYAPEARLVAMVRDPVEVAHSLHAQLLYTHDEDEPDFETAWQRQAERAAGRMIPKTCRQPAFLQYGEVASVTSQLERFLEVFSREQLKIIVFDDFKSDTRSVYRSVLAHLGAEDDGRTDFSPVNESKVHRRAWLARLTQRPPRILFAPWMSAKRALGLSDARLLARLRAANVEQRRREPIRPEFEADLRRYFADEVERLGQLLKRDLSSWTRDRVQPATRTR